MTPEQLQNFMDKFQLSRHDLAKLVAVTKPAVDHWIVGRRDIPAMVAKLLLFLDKYPALIGVYK